MLKNTMCKLIQRQTYTCLSHRYGIYFAYTGVVIVLYSMFHFGEELLEWSQHKYDVTFSLYHDNLASRSFQHKLCSQVPIDVVYTWVNGSDPELIAQLNNAKLSIGFNTTKNNETEISCNLKNCLLLPLLISKAENRTLEHNDKIVATFDFQIAKDVVSTSAVNATIYRFQSIKDMKSFHHSNHSLVPFHVTTDKSAPYSMKLEQSLILESVPNKIKTSQELQSLLPAEIKDKLDWMFLDSGKNMAFIWLTDASVVEDLNNDKSNSTLKSGFEIDGSKVKVHVTYQVALTGSYAGEDVVSKSRFEDNEELRYSLRSLEKYAPWVRHVYIVTNGQIPYWLDMDCPRVSVVTHDELFLNKSHLPTFSSPAIEAHLHRIPGLSERFIYFNDDVLFGKEVWPDDFYTETAGHSIYLAWAVPNCADGCAPSWITDGYCDSACNVSECNWDGGDCSGSNVKMGVGHSNLAGDSWRSSYASTYCKAGCSTNWLSDKFCDQSCNTIECGFDAGDCGLNDYDKIYKLTSKLTNGSTYHLPWGKHLAYIELSKTFSRVTRASYVKDSNLRIAAVSNKFHVLTIVFNMAGNQTEISFNVTGVPLNDSNTKTAVNNSSNADKDKPLLYFTFKVTAYPSMNTSNITDPNMTASQTISTTPLDVYDPVVIVIPENKRIPKVTSKEPLPELKLPFDLGLINRTLLPGEIQKKLLNLEEELKDEFLTDSGFTRKVLALLEPYYEVLKRNILRGNLTAVTYKRDPGLLETVADHRHDRGDLGEVQKMKVAHEEHHMRKEAKGHLESENTPKESHFVLEADKPPQKRKLLSLDSVTANQERGFLPWEHDAKLQEHIKEMEEKQKIIDQYATSFKRRKLLDTFGDSLRFVSGLYNKRFGFTQRKVPAHMPHFIHKSIMEELQSKFPAEYDQTSAHKLRHSQDMQFAFSYFYYIMSEGQPLNFSDVFDQLDTDDSGVLSDREIRLLATHLHDLPLTLQELTGLESELKQCAWELYRDQSENKTVGNTTIETYRQPLEGLEEWAVTERYYDKDMPVVTKELVLNCTPVLTMMNKTYGGKKKFKYREMEHGEVAFKMIRSNVSTVVGQLDDIRKNPKKFVCLNDNIDHNLEHAATVKAVVRDFYETLFPHKSQFELPSEYRNRFPNVRELRSWQEEHRRTLRIMHFFLAFLIFCIILSFFWDHLCRFWRRYRHLVRGRRRSRRHSPV